MQPLYHFGRGKAKLIPYALLFPGLGLFLLISVGPSIATAIFSFTDISGVPGTPWNWVWLDNYKEFFFLGVGVRDNLAPFFRTLIFCFYVTTIQTIVSLGVAILLNKGLRGTKFFRALFFIPVILGVTIQGLIWNLFLYPLDGPAQTILQLFGTHSDFLGSPQTAFSWVIFVQIWANMGYSMVIFLAGLQSVPRDLIEAGLIDGANSWQSFRYITFPLISATFTSNVLIAIIGSLQSWALLLVLTGGQFETSLLGYQIFRIAFGGSATSGGGSSAGTLRQGYAAAISMVQFFMILAITLISRFYLNRREEHYS